ncbi:hypothetical protein RJ639_000424 [Escallonia herrerae]|uniref:Flavin-containing monooxygenase n=1 Tax=Escallonia herrerae TaxID=1293975 RepID=A0AA89BLR4_9ASTE|nr:hypothetical protein RJ639_000424 [Escallonia herrerae]
MEIQEQAVIVVGAGPSGLSTAARLSQHSIPYILLEREDCFASLWKKKAYDRLHLHLAKQFCELPHKPFPSTCPTYLPRKEFIQYLDDYVTHFKISPLYQRSVESAIYDEATKKWKVEVRNVSLGSGDGSFEEYYGRYLVVATGETTEAFVPEVQGLSSFRGEVIHSTQYKNGEKYSDKHVLVVGSGNSGSYFSLILWKMLKTLTRDVCLVFNFWNMQIHILSRGMAYMGLTLLKHIPYYWVDSLLVVLSKLRYGDLTKYGIRRPQDGPFSLKVKYGKYPIIDAGTCKKIKSGKIQVLPSITSIRGNDLVFENGKSHPFDTLVFATGFKRSTNKWLQGDDYLLNDDGLPKPSFPDHWKGKNGLYCAGLARRGLYGAAMDAQKLADDIKNLL